MNILMLMLISAGMFLAVFIALSKNMKSKQQFVYNDFRRKRTWLR